MTRKITAPYLMGLLVCSLCLVAGGSTAAAQPASSSRQFASAARAGTSAPGSALWSRFRDLEVVDTLAFCSAPYGLLVMNVADPSTPTPVAQLYLPNDGWGVAIQGDILLLAGGSTGLHVIDISDALAPTPLANYLTPDTTHDVRVVDTLAYLACGLGGVSIVNVAAATSPEWLGTFDTPGSALRLQVVGSHAYVADFTGGLQIIDVADPTAPVAAGEFPTDGLVYAVAVAHSHAYIAKRPLVGLFPELMVVNISVPASPFLEGSLEDDALYRDYEVRDTLLFGGIEGGLGVVDISASANPSLLGEYYSNGYPEGVHLQADRLYVTEGWYFLTFDVQNPAAPLQLGLYDPPVQLSVLDVKDTIALVAGGLGHRNGWAAATLNVADPSAPAPLAKLALPPGIGKPWRVVWVDSLAYVAYGMEGFLVIDVSDATAPLLLDQDGSPGEMTDITLHGNLAYVAAANRLKIYDFTDPLNATLLSEHVTAAPARQVAYAAGYAYVRNQGGLIEIVDVSDSTLPVLAGSLHLQADSAGIGVDIRGIVVQDDYAYVAAGTYGVHVVDVADPALPTLVTTVETPYLALDLHLAGSELYVATYEAGVLRLNVANPSDPQLVITYDTPGRARDVKVAGGQLYVADELGFLVLSTTFTVGDVNGDGIITAGDIIFVVNHVFKGGAAPQPALLGDADCDGVATAADLIFMVNHVFKAGPAPDCP